jgi:hypothetical protein
MADTITFTQDSPEALESRTGKGIVITEGSERTWVCNYVWGAPSSPSAAAYRSRYGTGNGRDVSTGVGKVFPTNSPTAHDNDVTLSVAKNFTGDAVYKIVVTATVSTQVYKNYFYVKVAKAASMG